MTTVLIVEDHEMVRDGLQRILVEHSDLDVVAAVGSAEEALSLLDERTVDVCLLDLSLPGMGGLEALRDLNTRDDAPHVLVVSMHPESDYGLRCLREGADGYLTKGYGPADLVKAVRTVARGERFLTPSMSNAMAERLMNRADVPAHDLLSQREFEVFRRLASGESVSGIADSLCISVKTVSTYRTRVMQKLGMSRNAELTVYAVANELIPLGST